MAEQPPHSRRAVQAGRVVSDDMRVVVDTEGADHRGKVRAIWTLSRQRIGRVSDDLEIEERSAGDVALQELGARVAPRVGQMNRRVDDFDRRLSDPFGQPVH